VDVLDDLPQAVEIMVSAKVVSKSNDGDGEETRHDGLRLPEFLKQGINRRRKVGRLPVEFAVGEDV
jgi:hypothetical protein